MTESQEKIADQRRKRQDEMLSYRRAIDAERRKHLAIKAEMHERTRADREREKERHAQAMRDIRESHRRRSG